MMLALALATLLTKSPQTNQTPQASTVQGTDYTVATAHLDTNWLWTIQSTINDYIPKTYNDNFALFKKYPDYNFNFEGAIRYMFIKEYYPDAFQELKKEIAAKRWFVAGSAIVAGDVNLPSPESLIRQTLYANRFWKQNFGVTSDDLFLPDCFGFGYALPSIAHFCGLIGFSTQKLTWGSASGIPFPFGSWTGVDGSTIYAALNPHSYTTELSPDFTSDSKLLKDIESTGTKSGAFVAYRYQGTGDTGGAPTEKSVQDMEAAMQNPGPIKVLSAASDQLYHALNMEQFKALPNYNGELVLTTHGTGCYTGQAAMKLLNRENENLADSAERSATIADWLGGMNYPTQELRDAWIRFLWHQFHDDLTGTSIPQVYPFSWNDEVLSLNQFADVEKESLQVVTGAMNTEGPGVPIVVYNPMGIERKGEVNATVQLPSFWHKVKVLSSNRQSVPANLNGNQLSFSATVPSVGFAVYHVLPDTSGSKPVSTVSIHGHQLSNSKYDVAINGNGDIEQIYDKQLNKDLLKSPIQLELRDDYSPDWPEWEIKYAVETSAARSTVGGPAQIVPVNHSPEWVGFKITRKCDGSTFSQIVKVCAANDRIDIQNTVDWHSMDTLLKMTFPLDISNPKASYDLGLGVIQRGNDYDKKYEVPAQKWADLSEPDNKFGVSLATDCKYGWDKPTDNLMRLSLIHTPKDNGNFHYQSTNDLGIHHFTVSIIPHKGSWRTETDNQAIALNRPLVALQSSTHAGSLGSSFSFVKSNDPSVEIESVKKQEDGRSYIIKVFERAGILHHQASISFVSGIRSVTEVNGQENIIHRREAMSLSGNRIEFTLKPWQPRAFMVDLDPPEASYTLPATTWELKLPLAASLVGKANFTSNLTASTQAIPPVVEGPGIRYLIPTTLWHAQINSGGIPFKLGSTQKNYFLANCQVIKVPAGADRMEVLATSLSGSQNISIKSGYLSQRFEVPAYDKRIAQWENRMVNGKLQWDQPDFQPEYMFKTPVAWNATHRITTDGNLDTYKYIYLFKLEVEVPRGAKTITLPKNTHLAVFAVTAVRDAQTPASICQSLYHL